MSELDDAKTAPADAGRMLSTGAAAKAVGVSTGQLRLWERERLINPTRTESGRRLYAEADLERLRAIVRLRRFDGLNSAAIRKELGESVEETPVAAPPAELGARLRGFRSARGWSLASVAEQTGLSVSFLSAVERGTSSISIGNMIKLADLYGTSVPGLMRDSPPPGQTVLRPNNRPRFTSEGGLVVIEDLIVGASGVEAYRYEIQPGGSSEGDYAHRGEEFIYVLSGALDVSVDGESYRLTTGDSFYLRSSRSHRWVNATREPCAVLWVNVPQAQIGRTSGKGGGANAVWQRRSGKAGDRIFMEPIATPDSLQLKPGRTNSIVDVPGVKVGHYTHDTVERGITAVLFEGGATAGVSVRGANPGTLQTDALGPDTPWGELHAIGLTGGSLYGLTAITGITEWLARRGIGVQIGTAKLPLVAGAVIFDLTYTDPGVRPSVDWGIAAAAAAAGEPFARGSIGVGAGCTAGKGPGCVRTKGGVGTASLELPGGIVVGAIVAVNAMGGLVHPLTGELYATGGGFDVPLLYQLLDEPEEERVDLKNTTIGVIATNAQLDKYQLIKVSDLAHDGFARAIRPMHTTLDGDTIFAVSTWENPATLPRTTGAYLTDVIGAAAADAMVLAILDAAAQTAGVPEWPAAADAQRAIKR